MTDRAELDAKNSDGARDLYRKRRDYTRYSIETAVQGSVPFKIAGSRQQINFRSMKDFEINRKYLIGKVSSEQYAILPNPNKIKNIKFSVEGTNVSALDFVQTSFDQMAVRYSELRDERRVVTSPDPQVSLLEELRAVKGFESSLRTQLQNIQGFSSRFIASLDKPTKDRITSLRDFAELYIAFLLGPDVRIPYFLSDYIKSSFNPQRTSGLVIELSDASYGDDGAKVNDFLTNKNYKKLVGIALEYGFMIDKQIPWRLVADVNSKAMRQAMRDNGFESGSIDTVLEEYYSIVDLNDFFLMIRDMYRAYNSFIRTNSFSNRTSTKQEDESRVIIRNPIEIMQLSQIPTAKWIALFIRLKNKSSGISMGHIELNRIISTETEKVGYVSLQNIVTSINKKFNFTPYEFGSAAHRTLVRKKRFERDSEDSREEIKDFYVASLMNQY